SKGGFVARWAKYEDTRVHTRNFDRRLAGLAIFDALPFAGEVLEDLTRFGQLFAGRIAEEAEQARQWVVPSIQTREAHARLSASDSGDSTALLVPEGRSE